MAGPVSARRRDERLDMLPFTQFAEIYLLQNRLFAVSGAGARIMAVAGPVLGVGGVDELRRFLLAKGINDFSGRAIAAHGGMDSRTVCTLFRYLQDMEFHELLEGRRGPGVETLGRLREIVYPFLRPDQEDKDYLGAVRSILKMGGFADAAQLRRFLHEAGARDFTGGPLAQGTVIDAATLFAAISYSTGYQLSSGAAPGPVAGVPRRLIEVEEISIVVPRRQVRIAFPVPGANRLVGGPDKLMTEVDGRRTPVGYFRANYGEMRASGRHNALDIHAPLGSPIISPLDGVVQSTEVTEKGGNTVTIRSDEGFYFRLVHLDRIDVARGQRLARGDQVGTVGMTGTITPHLHIMAYTLEDGRMNHLNPIDLFEEVNEIR